jgi:hypothetical protein
MYAGTKSKMLSGLGPIDNKAVRLVDFFIIPISGYVSHHDFVTLEMVRPRSSISFRAVRRM